MQIKRSFAPLTIHIDTEEELNSLRQMAYYYTKKYQDQKWFGMKSNMQDNTDRMAHMFLENFK